MRFKAGDIVNVRAFPARQTFKSSGTEWETKVPAGSYKIADVWNDGDVLIVPSSDPDAGGTWCTGSLVEEALVEQPTTDTHASLRRVFDLAVAQTQEGKGADRHGNGEPFEDQLIMTMNQELGTNHGALFQAKKKVNESARLAATNRKDMAKAELLGAMVYLGAAYLLLEDE